jgi:hypothetical protein
MAKDLMSLDPALQMQALVRIRNAVCEPSPPVDELIKCGIVKPLVDILG